MCLANEMEWSNIDGALPQTKSPHLQAQNNRIPSLINGEYDKDTEGQWGFHRSEIFKTASKYYSTRLSLQI